MRQVQREGVFGRGQMAWVVAVLLTALPAGLLSACRSRTGPEAAGTHIATGDTLSGRLAPEVPVQAFTFEGVESSLLDFTLQSDELNRTAPRPVLTDPQGTSIDLAMHRSSPLGAATTRYEGIILMRTGAYQLSVASADRTSDSWYLFKHQLRFPSIVADTARLTESDTHPISFTAPYGGTVSVKIRPSNRSNLQPEVRGVIDPSGGRALDSTLTPAGVLPPQMAPTVDGGLLLVFVAPRAGRYTVLAAAKSGRGGEATIDVDVAPPSFGRAVWHNGADPTAPLPSAAVAAPRLAPPAPAPPPVVQPSLPPPSFPAPAAAADWSTPPAPKRVAQR